MADKTTKKPTGALPSLAGTGAGYTPIIPKESPVEEPKGKGKYKRSGHLQDQLLKYVYPRDGSSQLSIFDSLQEGTKKDIEGVSGIEVTEIVEGIRLSPSETKVVDSLCKLLHERSQTLDPRKEGYYSGNAGSFLVPYGDKQTLAPNLAFTLYELTSEYKGGDYVSGRDLENVAQVLRELDAKRFLMSYVETYSEKKGGKTIQTIQKVEEFQKLIRIVRLSETKYSKEGAELVELSKKEETVISLNPIFRSQIDSKFILYPNDITKRTTIAYGSHNLPETTLKLRDWLIRAHSAKRYKPEIGLDRLYYLLAEKWMNESRKKKVKEYTEKALETVIALGLLVSYEIQPSATGEPKVVFTLNKDWA
jgi:hypothetical protein